MWTFKEYSILFCIFKIHRNLYYACPLTTYFFQFSIIFKIYHIDGCTLIILISMEYFISWNLLWFINPFFYLWISIIFIYCIYRQWEGWQSTLFDQDKFYLHEIMKVYDRKKVSKFSVISSDHVGFHFMDVSQFYLFICLFMGISAVSNVSV